MHSCGAFHASTNVHRLSLGEGWFATLTTDPPVPRKARFQTGDQVRTVGPSVRPRPNNTGRVSEVLATAPASVFRYRVTFDDGSSDLFFGFELELIES